MCRTGISSCMHTPYSAVDRSLTAWTSENGVLGFLWRWEGGGKLIKEEHFPTLLEYLSLIYYVGCNATGFTI